MGEGPPSDYEGQLETLWIAEGQSGESAKRWAEEIVTRDVSDISDQKDLYEKAIQLIDALVSEKTGYETACDELQTATETLETVRGEIENQPDVESNQAIRLVDALGHEYEFIFDGKSGLIIDWKKMWKVGAPRKSQFLKYIDNIERLHGR